MKGKQRERVEKGTSERKGSLLRRRILHIRENGGRGAGGGGGGLTLGLIYGFRQRDPPPPLRDGNFVGWGSLGRGLEVGNRGNPNRKAGAEANYNITDPKWYVLFPQHLLNSLGELRRHGGSDDHRCRPTSWPGFLVPLPAPHGWQRQLPSFGHLVAERQPLTFFWGLYNPTIIERLTLFGLGYSAPKGLFDALLGKAW